VSAAARYFFSVSDQLSTTRIWVTGEAVRENCLTA
jgi:hypothetical protein